MFVFCFTLKKLVGIPLGICLVDVMVATPGEVSQWVSDFKTKPPWSDKVQGHKL
jgi:hypothetical protein